jgi:hypothetical protein
MLHHAISEYKSGSRVVVKFEGITVEGTLFLLLVLILKERLQSNLIYEKIVITEYPRPGRISHRNGKD